MSKKIVIMNYNKGSIVIRGLTPQEVKTEIYEGTDSDCEYMVVDKLVMDICLK